MITEKIKLKWYKRNELESLALREFFSRKFDIDVGMYSYGCFDASRIPRGTTIGRYCSFAPNSIIFSRNHGLNYLSTHPYLYNSALGIVPEDTIRYSHCVISDDVWLGQSSIICPNVTSVGRGAVIGAGAVVTRDVPPYAVVAGNPAVVIKSRFSDAVIDEIEKSRWWEMGKEELLSVLNKNPNLIFDPNSYFSRGKN